MNDDLPSRMPPRPPPLPPTTRVPRVFSIGGTIAYGGCAITALASLIAYGFGFPPPWFITMSCLLYVFVSAGIIATGRIEANKDAKVFTRALRRQSEENKRRMN